MAYYSKSTGARIKGTLETASISYPITLDPETGGWTYSGEESTVWDEGTEPRQSPDGEPLFLTVEGAEVPWSDLEWRGAWPCHQAAARTVADSLAEIGEYAPAGQMLRVSMIARRAVALPLVHDALGACGTEEGRALCRRVARRIEAPLDQGGAA